MYTHDNFKTIGQFFVFLFMNLSVINIVLFNNFYNINVLYTNKIRGVIERTIIEFDEIDLQHLCVVSECTKIGFDNGKSFNSKFDKNNLNSILQPASSPKINFIFESEALKITEDFNLYTSIPKYQMYAITSLDHLINKIVTEGYMHINLVFLVLYLLIFIILEFKARRKKILELMNTSNILREKNMQILTENIHHELNTPVAIIQGNIKKLEIEMSGTINCEVCTKTFYFDFGQIYSSIEQIDTVLQRMSNFKNLKYSNGNKTLKNIIEYSSNSMSIYKKANFDIILDPELEKYRLAGPLKNGDLLNIVSNHFRNSLEANSSKIVTQAKYNKNTKDMHLYIIDNGVGLRDRDTGLLLERSKYNDIFKPYYSSKNVEGDFKIRESKGLVIDLFLKFLNLFKKPTNVNVRGVGLYLNKELLTEKLGDLRLRETSQKGTVFEIIFPVLEAHEAHEVQEVSNNKPNTQEEK